MRTFVVVIGVVLALVACTDEQPAPVTPANTAAIQAESTPQAPDLVDLTIYYRHGNGEDAHLEPVKREVEVAGDLPRTAMSLLLKGPAKGDPRHLRAPLPTTTRLLAMKVRKGTARVRLSREAVADARRVGRKPAHEAMALAAVANTLTEFPDIRRVRLQVAGTGGRKFWGGWGLPKYLVRDERIIEPAMRGGHVPSLDGFGHRKQRVGVAHRRRPPKVGAVRVASHATFVRVTVEVTSASGGPLKGPVPPTHVRHRGKRVVLKVHGRPRVKVAGNIRNELHDPAIAAARVDVRRKPHQVVINVRPRRRAQFWLHTLSEPARVVLDIRR